MAVPLTLKVFKGEALVTSQDFERDIIKIGRLSSAHLRLEDEKVSRVHSVLEAAADGTLSIIDMGSVEGTYVNGKRVNKGKVTFGDEIKVGGLTVREQGSADGAARRDRPPAQGAQRGRRHRRDQRRLCARTAPRPRRRRARATDG